MSQPTTTRAAADVPEAHRAAIVQLLSDYVKVVDSRDIHQWPDLFADAASYQVISRENHDRGWPASFVLDDSRQRILDRVTYVHEVWRNAVNDYTPRHFISLPELRLLEQETTEYALEASVCVYMTTLRGESKLLAVGTYEDRVAVGDGSARFISKKVILDTAVLPRYFIYPL